MINSYLNGRNITTAVNPGDISSKVEPHIANKVTDKSYVFQPDDIYSIQPKLMILKRASSRNTTKIKYIIFLHTY